MIEPGATERQADRADTAARAQIVTLDHVQLAMPVGGEPAARAFYTDLLGLSEIEKPLPLRARGGCWFHLGDRQLHLGVDPDFRPARKAHPAVVVADLVRLRSHLEAANVKTADDEPLNGVERFFADDPFGNRLEFLARD